MFQALLFSSYHLIIFSNISVFRRTVRINARSLVSKLLITIPFSIGLIIKIKESFHIEQFKPELNKQVDHVSLAPHFSTFTVISVNLFS